MCCSCKNNVKLEESSQTYLNLLKKIEYDGNLLKLNVS